jgi:prophage regulatory protein
MNVSHDAVANDLGDATIAQVTASVAIERLLPMRDVVRLTSLSKATINRECRARRFPAPVRLTPGGRVAWPFSEVMQWIRERKLAA